MKYSKKDMRANQLFNQLILLGEPGYVMEIAIIKIVVMHLDGGIFQFIIPLFLSINYFHHSVWIRVKLHLVYCSLDLLWIYNSMAILEFMCMVFTICWLFLLFWQFILHGEFLIKFALRCLFVPTEIGLQDITEIISLCFRIS